MPDGIVDGGVGGDDTQHQGGVTVPYRNHYQDLGAE